MAEHPDLAFLSVAADLGGAAAARPWTEAAGATFPTVIDADNQLGRLLDYKVVPNGLFVDEAGVLQGKWISFWREKPECVAAVDRFRAGTLAPFTEERPPAGGGLSPLERELYETRIRLGAEFRAAGKAEAAAIEWQKALLMDPENYVLRKQIWATRFPEKFFPTIDFEWQKGQLARERAEEAAMRQAGCGPEGCVISR